MAPTIWGLLWGLGQRVAVAFVLVYLLSRTRYFKDLLDGYFTWKNQTIMVLFFGGLSILGTYDGVKLPSGAIVNVREMAPMVAGLVGGPLAGLGAGLIGGIHRYSLGGLTAVPCGLSTIIAGLAGGLIYNLAGRRVVPLPGAALFAFLMELSAMGLILLISRPYPSALAVVKLISLPMVVANMVGVGLTIFMVRNIKDRDAG